MGNIFGEALCAAREAFRKPKSSLQEEVNYREYHYDAKEFLKSAGILAGIVFLMSLVFYDSLLPGFVAYLPALALFLRYRQKGLEQRRRERLEKEFLYAMELLGDYLKSGYSVENGLYEERRELQEAYGNTGLILRELQGIHTRIRLGIPVEEAFRDFSARTGSEQGNRTE